MASLHPSSGEIDVKDNEIRENILIIICSLRLGFMSVPTTNY